MSVHTYIMSVHTYIDRLKWRHPELFKAKAIRITVVSFEEQLRAAYNAGEADGKAKAEAGGSLFDSLFGTLSGKDGKR